MAKETFEQWSKKIIQMDLTTAKKNIASARPSKLPPNITLQQLGQWFYNEKDKPWCQIFDQECLVRCGQPYPADHWVDAQWDKRRSNHDLFMGRLWKNGASSLDKNQRLGLIFPSREIYDAVIGLIDAKLNKLEERVEEVHRLREAVPIQANAAAVIPKTSFFITSSSNLNLIPSLLWKKIKNHICNKGSEKPLAKYAALYNALIFENYTLALQLICGTDNHLVAFELAKILLEHQPALTIDINAVNSKGNTAVHNALEKNNWELVSLLVKYKANPSIKNKSFLCANDYQEMWNTKSGVCSCPISVCTIS